MRHEGILAVKSIYFSFSGWGRVLSKLFRFVKIIDNAGQPLGQQIIGAYLFSAGGFSAEICLRPKCRFARFSVTVYTGSGNTSRSLNGAKM